jgi:hypothetical protein
MGNCPIPTEAKQSEILTDELLHALHGPQTTITAGTAYGEMMKEKGKEKNNYEKLQNDVAEEIGHLMKVLKTEIEWLEQQSKTKISTCSTRWELRDLLKLKDYLDRTKRELRRQNYFLGDIEGRVSYLLDGTEVDYDGY